MEQMLRPPKQRGTMNPILVEMAIVILFLALSTSVVVRLIAAANVTRSRARMNPRHPRDGTHRGAGKGGPCWRQHLQRLRRKSLFGENCGGFNGRLCGDKRRFPTRYAL